VLAEPGGRAHHDEFAATPPRPSTTSEDLWVVIAALTVATTSLVVEPTGSRTPLTLNGRTLPTICLVRAVTGHRCPSCGLTRAVVYLLRSDWRNALDANRLAPVALALGTARLAIAVRRLARPRTAA
jgi:hypothetical protein